MSFAPAAIEPGDTAWVLISSALVLVMTPGVAFLYGGMVRTKKVLGTMMQSYVTMAVVGLMWVLVSYSLAFGGTGPLIGNLHYAGMGNMISESVPGFDGAMDMRIPPIVYAIFQMMFAIITAALITGSAAERWRFSAFLPFMVLWTVLIYAPVAHWMFSPEGWAARLGALDFAGGTVVHCNAGAAGLALAVNLGKRRGWPEDSAIRPHNLPLTLLGVALLWFGWFGFNAGSALQANALAGYAFLNTNTATSAALLGWMAVEWRRYGSPTSLGAASGAVAGLVAITPCAGYVSPMGAIAIGLLAGVGCSMAVSLKNEWGKLDDSLDVVGIHLVGGVIGSLCVGLFATRDINPALKPSQEGLFFGGGLGLLGKQAVATLAVGAFSLVGTFALALFIDLLFRNRVDPDDEVEGLDECQHAESAYAWTPAADHR